MSGVLPDTVKIPMNGYLLYYYTMEAEVCMIESNAETVKAQLFFGILCWQVEAEEN